MQKGGPLLVGLSFAIANIDDTILAFVGGGLADKYGRKPILIFSALFYFLGSLLFLLSLPLHGLLAQILLFLATVCFYGMTGISSGPASAIVAESVESKELGKSFSLLSTASLLARALGSLTLGVIYEKNALAAGFVILALSLIVVIPRLFLGETLKLNHVKVRLSLGTYFKATLKQARSLLGVASLTCLVIFVICNGLAHGVGGNYYAPYLKDVLDMDEATLGSIFFALTLLQLVFTPLAGWLVDRRGDLMALVLGNVAAGVFVLVFALSESRAVAVPAMLISAGLGVFHGIGYNTAVARLSEQNFRATLYGSLDAAWNAMFVLGPVIGGVLYLGNPALPFVITSVLLLLTLIPIRRLKVATTSS
jgi:MFS family permease